MTICIRSGFEFQWYITKGKNTRNTIPHNDVKINFFYFQLSFVSATNCQEVESFVVWGETVARFIVKN